MTRSAGVDLVVALPSLNEAQTIASVTAAVDTGLASMHNPERCVIVNADNRSSDSTRERFLDTGTSCRKHYEPTATGVAGKGANVLNALRLAEQWEARATALVDSDLQSISPDWVPRLLEPVLRDGMDAVTPCYSTSQGGPLRNLISRPLCYALFGADIDQPTGGEIGLSAALVRYVLGEPVPPSAIGYGIDAFLVTSATVVTDRLAVADLGRKVHRRRPWPTITPIVQPVTETIMAQAERHQNALRERSGVIRPIRYGTPGIAIATDSTRSLIDRDQRDQLAASFTAGLAQWQALYTAVLPPPLMTRLRERSEAAAGITALEWRQAVIALVASGVRDRSCRSAAAAAAMPLFQARMATYAAELATLSPAELAESLTRERQALHGSRAQMLAAAEQDPPPPSP